MRAILIPLGVICFIASPVWWYLLDKYEFDHRGSGGVVGFRSYWHAQWHNAQRSLQVIVGLLGIALVWLGMLPDAKKPIYQETPRKEAARKKDAALASPTATKSASGATFPHGQQSAILSADRTFYDANGPICTLRGGNKIQIIEMTDDPPAADGSLAARAYLGDVCKNAKVVKDKVIVFMVKPH